MPYLRIQLLFILLLGITNFSNAGSIVSYTNEDTKAINLSDYLSVFEDEGDSIKIHDIITHPDYFTKSNHKHFGHTASGIWYRFDFNNSSNKDAYIQVTPEWTHHIEFYHVDTIGQLIRQKTGGTIHPYYERELKVNKHSFALGKNRGTYFIKISGDHVISPHFVIGEKIQLLMYDRTVDHVYFLYFGVIFLLFCYNSFLSLVTFKKSYIYYTTYIFLMLVGMLFIKGFINEWLDLYWLSNHSNIITSLMVICLMMSVAAFTKTKELYPILNNVKKIVIVFSIISLVLNIVGYTRFANSLILNMVFIGGVWGLIVGFNVLRNGLPSSIFIFLGYSSFILGGITHLLCLQGIIPYNWFTHNTYLIGSGLEVFLLSVAFAVNINTLRKDKYKTQIELVEMARKNADLIKEQNKVLEQRVTERTAKLYDAYEKIQETLNTVHEQKMLIENKSTHITDSIIYAKRIQDALLPENSQLKKHGLDIGIFYVPKDILSGDFYWFGERAGLSIIAVADCTGHGVPGAMMSIAGHNLLNKIVHEQKITVVDEILNKLHIELIELLNAQKTNTQDGMDIQVISINKETGNTLYAGARNPIYFIDKENKFQRIKGDLFSIGGTQTEASPVFTKHLLPQWKNIFLSSDGYQDQFGTNDKKFMAGSFKKSLAEISHETPAEQTSHLKTQFFKWKDKKPQTDDVLVMTIKKLP